MGIRRPGQHADNRSMRLDDVEQDLPILMFNYERVVRMLERRAAKANAKVPRREALELFLETRSFAKTARYFRVSPATINNIVFSAFRLARKMAGLTPVR
jgi:NRPS condensation-like uncharacterized protein